MSNLKLPIFDCKANLIKTWPNKEADFDGSLEMSFCMLMKQGDNKRLLWQGKGTLQNLGSPKVFISKFDFDEI